MLKAVARVLGYFSRRGYICAAITRFVSAYQGNYATLQSVDEVDDTAKGMKCGGNSNFFSPCSGNFQDPPVAKQRHYGGIHFKEVRRA